MILLPFPKHLEEKEGSFLPGLDSMIVLAPETPARMKVYAELLQEEIREQMGICLGITRGTAKKGDIALRMYETPPCVSDSLWPAQNERSGEEQPGGCCLENADALADAGALEDAGALADAGALEDAGALAEDDAIKKQFYTVSITPDGVSLAGAGADALGYAVQTLRQIVRSCEGSLPCLTIEDWPNLANRGFYHDIARGRILTLESLKRLADTMSFYKLNQLQLYVEASYLFRDIPELWRGGTPLTAQEIMELDDYCLERGIELVPSLSSFGHLFKLLGTRSCGRFCELEGSIGQPFSFKDRMDHHTVNVTDPGAMDLIRSLIAEYMQLFHSKKFNVCADETFDLGKGKSASAAAEKGVDILYVEYLKGLLTFLLEQGREPMFWGDILAKCPQVAGQLPKEAVCLTWGYSATQPDTEVRIISEAGVRQYVCPGVCGWNTWVNVLQGSYENIRRMTAYAEKYGAVGMLNTDWGDFGHINQPVFSVPGLIYGAVFSWEGETAYTGGSAAHPDGAEAEGMPPRGAASLESALNGSPQDDDRRSVCHLENADALADDKKRSLRGGLRQSSSYEALNREISMLEFTDRSGELLNLLGKITGEMVFSWNHVVTFKELTEKGISEVAWKFFREEDMSRVPESNARLDEIEQELCAVLPHMDVSARPVAQATRVAIEAVRCWNLAGAWLEKYGEKLFGKSTPDFALADRMDRCLYLYEQQWRTDSKENELYHIAEIFWWYGDLLRDAKIPDGRFYKGARLSGRLV
ncbi:MAG: beta-N-acetylhexosaminidase [Lachnospiraceae bacterium]|nr:beta-N-acetylhexosaminidase [Lachnospiraceae bacterium]